MLDAGDTFRVSRDGVTLVEAFEEVRLRIAYAAKAGGPTLRVAGGYRTYAAVWRCALSEWAGKVRGFVAGAQRKRAVQTLSAG